MYRSFIPNLGQPIVGIIVCPRSNLVSAPAMDLLIWGAARGYDMSVSVMGSGCRNLDLDDVPELSVTEKSDGHETKLKFTARGEVGPDELLVVRYEKKPWLLLGWHPVHHGVLTRVTESSSPRREGPPVSYEYTSPVAPLACSIK